MREEEDDPRRAEADDGPAVRTVTHVHQDATTGRIGSALFRAGSVTSGTDRGYGREGSPDPRDPRAQDSLIAPSVGTMPGRLFVCEVHR
ncbi:hypothetical protein GCM10010518_25170 [Kitasatospora cinereorecta]